MAAAEDLVARIYEQAEARLRVQLRQALQNEQIGTFTYRRAQHEAVRQVLAQLGRRTRPAVGKAIAEAYLEGVRQAQLVDGVEFSFDAGAGAARHRAAVAQIADRLSRSLEGTVAQMSQSAADAMARAGSILEEAAIGIASGETRQGVSQGLVRQLIDQGVSGLTDAGGKSWSLGTYARMAARTETRNAASSGTVNRMRDFGQDLVTISSHSPTCEICANYDGNTYSLDGTTQGYDVIDQLPPFHPNCLHVVTPAAEAFDAAEAALLGA